MLVFRCFSHPNYPHVNNDLCIYKVIIMRFFMRMYQMFLIIFGIASRLHNLNDRSCNFLSCFSY